MSNIKVIEGDLIELAKKGEFDLIAQGCNCFSTMGAGIAVGFKKEFKADQFPMEQKGKGDYNKLGQIDYKTIVISDQAIEIFEYVPDSKSDAYGESNIHFCVINAYTQYHYGGNKPFDYTAFTMCMRKINHTFKGMHIGLPMIGAGLAGGIWDCNDFFLETITERLRKNGCDGNGILQIIEQELRDLDVTIVKYNK